jgi:fluoride exporter
VLFINRQNRISKQNMGFFWVFIGGGLGSVCRYGLALAMQPLTVRFPWATLAANVLACVVVGVLMAQQQQANLSDTRRLLLLTGFCGGLSTFSTFTGETWRLFAAGDTTGAITNIALNLLMCFLGLWCGIAIFKT